MTKSENKSGKKKLNLAELYGKYGTFAILVIIFTLSSIFTRGFATQANLTNVLRQITVVTILALGATFVIILGHINVAYGSMIALIGVISTAIMVATGSVFVAVMGAVGLGLVIGGINGYVITKFHIPAFIMTLAVTTVARGAVLLFTNGVPITGMGSAYTFIGQGYIGFMPVSVLILIVLFIISWIMLNKTRFGRHVYAVGGNEQAAIASGIKSKNVVRKAFLFDGFTAAIAGVVLMSRMNSGQPAAGLAYEFDAITAVVVGGTSLAGGSGTVVGTIIGAVIVGIINNVQNLANVNTYWQQIVKGLIILIAVIIDKMTKRASSAKK
ncbi:ABC transporter permease [Anaerotalea alkaliphila]|uniref:ABC transporter permease n=1 Tax=Anaerotalea alkaliphila TaxID=2662126 RepID=A0A7X5HTM3_9FIRM|nr:ABC transporter permease [Anaerotalea alkaliphila]NDL66442.1 ABC transporter permease [Anaerotalea alkaliphila]